MSHTLWDLRGPPAVPAISYVVTLGYPAALREFEPSIHSLFRASADTLNSDISQGILPVRSKP
jgi:hypothetical protein